MWDPEFGNFVYESLMQRSRDEPFTLYGLLAQSVEWDDKRSYIQFNINPKARWSDGQPVTADDVIFSFELLRDKARPPYSTRLNQVAKMEKVGNLSVKFTLNDKADREFPLILGLSPVLPKHATKADGFDQTTLVPPLGSGPYKIKSIKTGEKIVYQRDPNYWAKDLPSKVGFDNYDEVSIEYFSQENTLFEAFKKGEVDVYAEGNPTKWIRNYDFPAIKSGDVIKDAFEPHVPASMYAMVFNTRRPMFADIRLRKGLTLAFDFQWVNKNLYENAYARTESFWQNSTLSSLGIPASARELQMLGPAKDKIEPEILNGSYHLPVTDGSGRDRKVLKQAYDLFRAAGYKISGSKMIGPDGRPLAFEIMTQNEDQEKLAISYQRTLAALGIVVAIRTVDDAQYQERTNKFDYDMIIKTYASSLSPGSEQVRRWGSASRDAEASENIAGVADPAVDAMIQHILTAVSEDDFEAAVRAYDRLLISGHYVIPLFHIGEQWVARWKHIGHPQYLPLYGAQYPVWWDERVQ
jgi:peptide/nickel transport system substrate-binding protein